MRLRTETRYNNSVAILRGPLFYSLRVGMEPKRLPSWHPSARKGVELGFPAVEDLELILFGSARLRVTELPAVE